MIETHPFGNFAPRNAQYLILGTFTGKAVDGYDWFYSNKRNQFWPIMEEVYGVKLNTKTKKQKLFERLGMAIADIILSCMRKSGSNMDTNLTYIVINDKAIKIIIRKNKVKTIFFTSRFAEKLYKKHFKDSIQQFPKIRLITLPSPSPRYAIMSKAEKIKRYKKLLPVIK